MPKAEITVTIRLRDQDTPMIESQVIEYDTDQMLAAEMFKRIAEIRGSMGVVDIIGQAEEFRYVPIERILDIKVTRKLQLIDNSTNINAAAALAQTSQAVDATLRSKQPIPFARR